MTRTSASLSTFARSAVGALVLSAAGCTAGVFVPIGDNVDGSTDAGGSSGSGSSGSGSSGSGSSGSGSSGSGSSGSGAGSCCPTGWEAYSCTYADGGAGFACHDPAKGCASTTTCGGGCDPVATGDCGGSGPGDASSSSGSDSSSPDGGSCCPAGWSMYSCNDSDGGAGLACHDPARGCASSLTCGMGCDAVVTGRCGDSDGGDGGSCQTNTDCGADALCVAFVTTVGPTSTTKRTCHTNPCGQTTLSCSCAASLCSGFGLGECSVSGPQLTCNNGGA
jgi:hypothetical protein